MAMRKKCDISFYRSDSGNELIDPGGNLRRAFSARAAVGEEHPAWCLCTDFVRGQSLILPIVPLNEGGINLSLPAGSRLSIRTPGGGGWGVNAGEKGETGKREKG
jgi:hypothetical protein